MAKSHAQVFLLKDKSEYLTINIFLKFNCNHQNKSESQMWSYIIPSSLAKATNQDKNLILVKIGHKYKL